VAATALFGLGVALPCAQGAPVSSPSPAIGPTAAASDSPSKDELFGTGKKSGDTSDESSDENEGKKPETTSKDTLFGTAAPETPAVKLSGAFDSLVGYTYADPAHWSRAVGRLSLAAQGAFSESVKWKVAGRVDGDLVYATSNFYLEPVKQNERFSAIWGENYLDVSAGSWDFRLGAQQIIWGEVIGLFFADVVSARDTRDFLLPSFDIIRIPQWAVRAEYFGAGDSHLELIWIPVPTFDRIGKPGADFYPAPLPSPTPASVAAIFLDPVRPDRTASNSNFGVRGNTLISGWDLAAFYYRSFATAPTFYRLFTGVPQQPFVFQPSYDRIWQAGGTMSKDLGDFVLRGEAVYTNGQGYSVTSLDVPQGVVKRSTFDYILSAEFPLPNDSRLNVQVFQDVYYGSTSNFIVKNDGLGASVFLSTKLNSYLEPQILWIQNFRDAGGMIRPRLNWNAAKNTVIGFGVDIFTGSSDGYFGRYNNRDRVYTDLRIDF
jgi:hypothetical protein